MDGAVVRVRCGWNWAPAQRTDFE